VLGQDRQAGRVIARMAQQERRHLKRFDALMAERGVRPTALQPLWNVAGFALGAATALMSERAAMACTDAVETEIDRHYGQQLGELGDSDSELAADIAEFRAEELEHRDTAREHGAAETIGYPLMSAAIRAGCRLAIGLSKRI
jgi:ubiquinone biosynthesis monooxygenase Coq7